MDLTDADLGSLARFLAPRVTPEGRPAPPVTDLGHPVDPTLEQAWTKALLDARARGRLAVVLQQAADARPDDEALREAVSLVPGVRPVGLPEPRPAAALAVVVAMLLAMFGFASVTTAGVVLLVQSALPAPGAARDQVAAAPPADVPTPGTAAIGVVLSAPAPTASVAAPARVQLEPPRPVGPCEREGWFYAGWRRPSGQGVAGDTFVVPFAVNVRAVPPSAENRWNSSSEVRCYLKKGDVVHLDRPPVDAGHGQLWIHVGPGLVVRP